MTSEPPRPNPLDSEDDIIRAQRQYAPPSPAYEPDDLPLSRSRRSASRVAPRLIIGLLLAAAIYALAKIVGVL